MRAHGSVPIENGQRLLMDNFNGSLADEDINLVDKCRVRPDC